MNSVFLLQKDFNVREMREFNKNIMSQVGMVVSQHPDIGEAVNMYFSQVFINVFIISYNFL